MEILLVLILLFVALDFAYLCWGIESTETIDSPEWQRRASWSAHRAARAKEQRHGSKPAQHEADQHQELAELSGHPTGLMHAMAGRPGVFLLVLGAGLKELGQRMRPKPLPPKQRRLWSQSPHH
jgi:hypothetical protein